MTLDEAIKHEEEVADYDCYNEEQFKCSEEHRQLAGWLMELKKLIEQTRWIPVTERLPEDFEDVLVWYEYFRYGDYNRMFQTYGIGCYISNTGTWSGDPGTGTKVKVIAWMPLPEPYKAESEDKR